MPSPVLSFIIFFGTALGAEALACCKDSILTDLIIVCALVAANSIA